MSHDARPHDARPHDARPHDALPVAPSMEPTLRSAHVPLETGPLDKRVLVTSGLAIVVAACAALAAQVLTRLIALITNISFFGRVSTEMASPADHHLGAWVIAIPMVGGLLVGLLARFGSKAIRGHGIPEAMEQVLTNESRIPVRLTFLKPISAALSIGTGGPFGAEGPIIATGGAMGSVVGQLLKTTADERKILLSAGAAAGMAATFGSPVSAVLLAIELLLFEYRARSVIPVALAAATATGIRAAFVGLEPAFATSALSAPSGEALAIFILLGGFMGVASVFVTRAVYGIEDAFEKLPIHWMWWPIVGAIAVGIAGYFSPKTLGVGYDNIERILSGDILGYSLAALIAWKFVSWSISLGSGTSGGTLAPLFTVGGGIGVLVAAGLAKLFPSAGIDPRMGGLVGMAAMFAGSSRALLASVVFAFETTRQSTGLLPLLGGCTGAFLVSALMMRNSIMTEKISRRGVRVSGDYAADLLDSVVVSSRASKNVAVVKADTKLDDIRRWLRSGEPGSRHQGYPVLNEQEHVIGVITRKEVLAEGGLDGNEPIRALIKRRPVAVYENSSLRDAVEHMVHEGVGRLVVVKRGTPWKVEGILTRSDVLSAYRLELDQRRNAEQTIDVKDVLVAWTKPIRPKS